MLLTQLACDNEKTTINLKAIEIEQSPSEDVWVEMLVEIPAGTIEKYEFNKVEQVMKIDSIDGKPRLIEYLGYPGNYGMIPKTLLPKNKGGDGDPLDILAIGAPATRGSILKCKIIGVLKLLDRGETDDKLIAVADNSTLQNIGNLNDLDQNYPGISEIIKLWFENYKGNGKMQFMGFGNKQEALQMLEESKKHYQ